MHPSGHHYTTGQNELTNVTFIIQWKNPLVFMNDLDTVCNDGDKDEQRLENIGTATVCLW